MFDKSLKPEKLRSLRWILSIYYWLNSHILELAAYYIVVSRKELLKTERNSIATLFIKPNTPE